MDQGIEPERRKPSAAMVAFVHALARAAEARDYRMMKEERRNAEPGSTTPEQ